MKLLIILFAYLLPTSLWAIDIHTFKTEYVDLLQVNGKVLGLDVNGTAHSLELNSSELSGDYYVLPEKPLQPDDILPDGLVVVGKGMIKKAWLGGPTDRYNHGVMLDNIEATRLYADVGDEKPVFFELKSNWVFEDRFPRLVDFDNDGQDELVVIRTDIDSGASIAVYGLNQGRLILEAASDTIGLSHRWLNIIGIEDFDGDGIKEIAAVITPHIGGDLTLFRQRENQLVPVSTDSGYSNHEYGSRELGMSASLDFNHDGVMDMAVPDARRRDLILLTFTENQLVQYTEIENNAGIKSGIYVAELDGDALPELVYLLKDNTLKVIDF